MASDQTDRADPPEQPGQPDQPDQPDPSEPDVVVERHDLGEGSSVAAVVRLNKPQALNPIDRETIRRLDAAIDGIVADPTVRAVLVTGTGRAFSAGGDLKKYIALQRDPVMFPEFVGELHRVFGRFRDIPLPVVALVNGITAAGGLELILNCDFAYVGASARIGDGHLNFGQMGGGGVLTLLPRTIGRARAAELLFSGRFLTAEEAVQWGLASRVVPDDDLFAAGLDFAREVAVKSPLAVANAKQVMNRLWADNGSVESSLRYELERDAYYCLTSHDAPEGLAAFSEKRSPDFQGR